LTEIKEYVQQTVFATVPPSAVAKSAPQNALATSVVPAKAKK